MREHKRVRVLTRIAGGLLLVSVLHDVLDEPSRSALIQAVFAPRHRTLRRDTRPAHFLRHDIARNDQRSLRNASFEQWEEQPPYLPHMWFTVMTISPGELIDEETEIVPHGRSAVRLKCDGEGHCGNVRQELPSDAIPPLRERRLTFSVWALSTTPGAPCVRIDDGIDRSSACLQNHRGTWQPVTVERIISPEAARVVLIIEIPRAAETTLPVYVDRASLTEGPPSSEDADGR